MAEQCFQLEREERLERFFKSKFTFVYIQCVFRFSFAVLFTGKWGSFEAEQEAKKQKKEERALRKQQSEKVKVEGVAEKSESFKDILRKRMQR